MKRNGVINRARFAVGTPAPRRARDYTTQNRDSGRSENAGSLLIVHNDEDFEKPIARRGTLTRTKALLLAAVRLWELKRGLRE